MIFPTPTETHENVNQCFCSEKHSSYLANKCFTCNRQLGNQQARTCANVFLCMDIIHKMNQPAGIIWSTLKGHFPGDTNSKLVSDSMGEISTSKLDGIWPFKMLFYYFQTRSRSGLCPFSSCFLKNGASINSTLRLPASILADHNLRLQSLKKHGRY